MEPLSSSGHRLAHGVAYGALLLLALSPAARAQTPPPRDSAVALPALRVEAARRARHDRRLEQARSLGGTIVAREKIEQAAPTARTLGDLLRRTAGAHVTVVSGYGGTTCLLVQRMANLQQQQVCALLVVDEVASGGDAYIAPGDVELVVIVPASAASVRFGERGRFGAVLVYTKVGKRDGGQLPRV